ncbi:hypothetical protein ACFV1C_23930 [Streptomyces sp. NPDC059605]|uniref:hypothetical protein n=1 Tax=unclassified Streptomyces TaxID=2593676 RepID=UPI0033AB4176
MPSPTRMLVGTVPAVGAAGCTATEYRDATTAGPAGPAASPRPRAAPTGGESAVRLELHSRATPVTTAEVQR